MVKPDEPVVYDGKQFIPLSQAKELAKAGRVRMKTLRDQAEFMETAVKGLEERIATAEKGTD